MRVSRNIAIVFLVLFALVALANLVVPFFLGFNVYFVSILMLFLVALFSIIYRRNDSLKVKLLKGLILVIPIIFFGFVIYSNVNTTLETNYFYDLGGVQEFKSSVLFPSERVSLLKENVSHRNLTAPMVYFNVPAEYSEGNISIALNIRDNLPRNDSLIIGAKVSSSEEYITQVVYTASANRTNLSSWKTVYAEFNTSDMFVEDGEYTFYINAPHLGLASKKNSYVSIDWINVTERD